VIQDQAVIQAEEFKAQKKTLEANRDNLKQRTPELIRVVLSGAPSSGIDREDDDD
jgi:hypothetical protein